ncbi:hypothetical protein [Streptomyces sp. NPDC021356]|uniref:hypothetical protein n=1 Tax=Streptomyces sp. NPDC021356 TaxID=3154900 RepID=UPI0033D09008
MPLTRPGPPRPPQTERTPPAPRDASGGRAPVVRAKAPGPGEPTLRALRWEALLGDPDDPANPYGRAALAAGDPPRPDPAWGPLVPEAADGYGGPADQLVRVLRPLLRRDAALADDWVIRPLLTAAANPPAGEPRAAVGYRARLAELLGPAALIAATGDLLRTTVRLLTAPATPHPGARQWRPVLAAVFADLLACESLTTVALRALRMPAGSGAGVCGGAGVVSGVYGISGVSGVPGASGTSGAPGAPGKPAGSGAPRAFGVSGAAGVPAGSGAADAAGTQDDDAAVLPAVVGYVVPHLVGGLLGDLELVLNDSLSGPAAGEREALARQSALRTAARVDRTAMASAQARLIRLLPRLADSSEQPDHPGEPEQPVRPVPPGPSTPPAPSTPPGNLERPPLRELFRLGAPDASGGGGGEEASAPLDTAALDTAALAAVLPGAAGRPARAGDGPARAALTRYARRLATEQRALRGPSRSAAAASDPAARALADRQALLLLAAAVLGVQEAAAQAQGGFLGGCDWALLALERVIRRLGVPLPGGAPDPGGAVWTELAERIQRGVDCDVYGTRLLW